MTTIHFALVCAMLIGASNSFVHAKDAFPGCWRSVEFGPSKQAPNHGDFGHIFCFNKEGGVKITGFMGHFVTFKYGHFTQSGSEIEFVLTPDPTGITRAVWPPFAYAVKCDFNDRKTNELLLTNCREPQSQSIRGDIALRTLADKDTYPSLRPPSR